MYNTVTKLVQVPLLSIATTTVAAAKGAEEQQQRRQEGGAPTSKGAAEGASSSGSDSSGGDGGADAVSSAASAALLVAAGVGLAVAGLLLACGPSLAAFWGLGSGSALRGPALDFLTLRAIGAPVSIVLLVAQVRRRGGGQGVGGGCQVCASFVAAPGAWERSLHAMRKTRFSLPRVRLSACAGLLQGPAGHTDAILCNPADERIQHRCAACAATCE